MIEEEGPAVPADEVGTVEEGAAQAGAGSWALPESGSVTACPKCGPVVDQEDDDEQQSYLRISIHFHKSQRAYAPDEPDAEQFPCAFLSPSLFPEQVGFGVGGEHLCVRCLRCKYGWVERVSRPESIYRLPPQGDE